jgi:hypothetical protein
LVIKFCNEKEPTALVELKRQLITEFVNCPFHPNDHNVITESIQMFDHDLSEYINALQAGNTTRDIKQTTGMTLLLLFPFVDTSLLPD